MTAQRQLLLVVPKLPFELKDDIIVPLIYRILGYPEVAFTNVPGAIPYVIDNFTGAKVFDYIHKKFAGKKFGVVEITQNIELLGELTRGLLNKFNGIENLFPNLRVVSEADQSLNDDTSSDGVFHTGLVYASHPMRPDYFIQLSKFHPYLLDDKKREFLRIAAGLGCKSISLIEGEEKTEKASVSAGVSGIKDVGDVSASVGTKNSSRSGFKLKVQIEDPEPSRLPYAPKDLLWLNEEPLWKAMIELRLKNWISSFQVEFSYDTNFDVDASLVAGIKGIGLKIGGDFHEENKIRQTYQIDFFPRSCYDASPSVKQPKEPHQRKPRRKRAE